MARDIGTRNRQIEQQIEKNISGRSNRKKILIQIIFLLSLLLPNSSNSVALFYFFLFSLLEQFFIFEVFVKLFHLSSRPSKQNKKARMSQFLFLASSVSISCRKFFEEKVGKCFAFWMIMSCLKFSSLVLPEKVTTFALVLELAAH